MKDYYKILGVEKNASKEDLKKAFRRLAHQYHPDVTKNDPAASQKFKEASEAYSILSDDSKRRQYDAFGSAGVGAGGPGAGGFQGGYGGFNPNDFGGFDFSGFQQGGGQGVEFDLGDIFGDLFGGGRGRGRQAAQEKGRDVSVDMQISFDESVFGAERDILLTKSSECLTCHGTGVAPGAGMETCHVCGGKGKINETRRSFIGVFSTTRVCDACHGKGQVPKTKCPTCHGEGVMERRQEIAVKIPAGIEDSQMVRLAGMGEAISNGMSGDLYVKVHVRAHPFIRKSGLNLETDLKVRLTDALLGAEIAIKTLDGDLILKIPGGVNTGEILRVKGKGVPNDRGKRGDLLVRIIVDMPKKISKEAKRAIDDLRGQGL